ncbi:hypothetical protein CHS0354_010222 [Potamilus streckersoni]|uniref:Uncharacterized protein n=1 Tax=Potamilus streckersoni TaxID=2493646 RepID=A0AAE0RSL2_9BIVA|nr:hypothetical protein CHS0354_010222 [Potamilus streckersoni]
MTSEIVDDQSSNYNQQEILLNYGVYQKALKRSDPAVCVLQYGPGIDSGQRGVTEASYLQILNIILNGMATYSTYFLRLKSNMMLHCVQIAYTRLWLSRCPPSFTSDRLLAYRNILPVTKSISERGRISFVLRGTMVSGKQLLAVAHWGGCLFCGYDAHVIVSASSGYERLL